MRSICEEHELWLQNWAMIQNILSLWKLGKMPHLPAMVWAAAYFGDDPIHFELVEAGEDAAFASYGVDGWIIWR